MAHSRSYNKELIKQLKQKPEEALAYLVNALQEEVGLSSPLLDLALSNIYKAYPELKGGTS